MLNVKTTIDEFGKIITISNNENSFRILYRGNLDLYFDPVISRMELLEGYKPIEFVIEEIDSEIFPLFDKLYQTILRYELFDKIDDDMESEFLMSMEDNNAEYERKKDSYREYPLVHDEIITWHSDDDIAEKSSILNIKKEKGKIILEFKKSHPDDKMYMTYSIRFRNSGSRYDPFNFRFMELYNELCKIDFNYHQVTIQEYISELENDNLKKLKKQI